MRIGILVDGDAEFHALPSLIERVQTPNDTRLKPLRCNLHPLAPAGQIALRAARDAQILFDRGADQVLLLIDQESRDVYPGEFAQQLAQEIDRRLGHPAGAPRVAVVVKVRMFENWLIADPEALHACPGLLDLRRAFARRVAPDRADTADGLSLLRRWGRPKGGYDKVRAAKAICDRLDPRRAAQNSRSFRRWLRLLGDPSYSGQSRLPARSG